MQPFTPLVQHEFPKPILLNTLESFAPETGVGAESASEISLP